MSPTNDRSGFDDDLPSFDPFVARGVRVYGLADDPVERTGMVGPGWFVRVRPTESWSWNLAGEPVGENWYPARHAVHPAGVGGRRSGECA